MGFHELGGIQLNKSKLLLLGCHYFHRIVHASTEQEVTEV